MTLESREEHVELHRKTARYQAAVLLFHLRKIEDPYCEASLPSVGLFERDAIICDHELEQICQKLDRLKTV